MKLQSISVVIASGAGGEFLFRCLDSLRDQVISEGAEVIVADRCGGDTRARLGKEYAFVTVVNADRLEKRPSVPELRGMGVSQAKGDIVAIIEEHCVAPSSWLSTIRRAFQSEDAAIGGPILDHDYPRIRDWVVYFSEYHNYLPPWVDGDRYQLNGANIAYQRESLLRHQNLLDRGFWEVVFHPTLAKEGRFHSVPEMGVRHSGPFDFGYYLGQRYLLSRVWGGTQRAKVGVAFRLGYLLAAPILPVLLLGRIAHRVVEKRHRMGKFILALPLLVPVALAYVWGEWMGYLSGVGDALEKVE